MSESRVTITLGRSGQVVKRPRATSNGASAESYVGNSGLPMNKRLRGDVSIRNTGFDRPVGNGARFGRNDLRLKLMRKRTSRRIQLEVEEHEKMELREEMSRTIQSPEGLERSLFRHIPAAKRASEQLPIDSLRRSYTSRTLDGLNARSPVTVVKPSRAISPTPRRSIDEFRQGLSTRSIGASRAGRLLSSDLHASSSRPTIPASLPMRTNFDVAKSVAELPPTASGVGPSSSYFGEQPVTVSGLLQSLGLEKYFINFRHEEVDMAVLKQMGDHDLKELGIPMGPRKKILLALLSQSRRQQLRPYL